jgi:hypothetical protein
MQMLQLSCLNREPSPTEVQALADQIRKVIEDEGATVEFRQTGAGTDRPAIQIVAGPTTRMDWVLSMIPSVLPTEGGLWRVEHLIGPNK